MRKLLHIDNLLFGNPVAQLFDDSLKMNHLLFSFICQQLVFALSNLFGNKNENVLDLMRAFVKKKTKMMLNFTK